MAQQKKRVVTYEMVLNLAHQKGLESIETEALTVTETFAFFKAVVTMESGKRFIGHGDASPANVRPDMVPSMIRLAETRAKARALRDAVNIGEVALEELPDFEHGQSSRTGSVPAGAAPMNDSGHQCEHCFAPEGKRHGVKCPITLQAAPMAV